MTIGLFDKDAENINFNSINSTKQPPAEAGGFGLRTGSPDTRRLNDASFCGSVLKSSFGFGSK